MVAGAAQSQRGLGAGGRWSVGPSSGGLLEHGWRLLRWSGARGAHCVGERSEALRMLRLRQARTATAEGPSGKPEARWLYTIGQISCP